MHPDQIEVLNAMWPLLAIIAVAGILGRVVTTWMRMQKGYPVEGKWGQAIYPKHSEEAMERIKLLTQENGQLRAELGSVKDRLANVERIVTDGAHQLDREIEQLRVRAN